MAQEFVATSSLEASGVVFEGGYLEGSLVLSKGEVTVGGVIVEVEKSALGFTGFPSGTIFVCVPGLNQDPDVASFRLVDQNMGKVDILFDGVIAIVREGPSPGIYVVPICPTLWFVGMQVIYGVEMSYAMTMERGPCLITLGRVPKIDNRLKVLVSGRFPQQWLRIAPLQFAEEVAEMLYVESEDAPVCRLKKLLIEAISVAEP